MLPVFFCPLLFYASHFTLCFRIAKSQHYDSEGLIDIFRQYGDHLYTKGDHNAAIEQYIKTIGKLEPSYVIRKVYLSLLRWKLLNIDLIGCYMNYFNFYDTEI